LAIFNTIFFKLVVAYFFGPPCRSRPVSISKQIPGRPHVVLPIPQETTLDCYNL